MNVADFLEQIKATGTVKAVRLILVDPYNWAFVTALDESSLNKAGCNYTTQDQKLISDMVDILRSANIKAAHGEELPKIWEPCEGIYILLANGTEVRFLFDARGAQEKIRGKFNEDLITADLSLPESLYKWASKLKVNSKCESFISRYRNK